MHVKNVGKYIMNKSLQNWLIVVPARLHSTRLKEKPLVDLCGKALITRVCERLRPMADRGAKIIVATDNEKIAKVCREENIQYEMTRVDHQSGTDRVFEVSQKYDHPFILNVQGDEPFVNLEDLESLMQQMEASKEDSMGTMLHKSEDIKAYTNPNVVKAVISNTNEALYFSRSAIPHYREGTKFEGFWQHIGVYAFKKSVLESFCKHKPSSLEKSEKLEQLRALENNIPICATIAEKPAIGIDTLEDLEEAREYFIKLHPNLD